MNFKKWVLAEMASFSVPAREKLVIPCGNIKLPCKDGVVGAIDMRFEGPPAYDPPFNKFNNGSKFIAQIPGTNRFLVYHGSPFKPAGVMSAEDAHALNYPAVPNYWFERAEVMDTDYNVLKKALGDETGERQAFFKQ